MGVDACMFVRHKGEPLSDAEVKKISYLMTSTFGHRKFLQYEKGEIGDYPERRALRIVEPFVDEYDEDPELVGKIVVTQDGPPIIAEDGEQFLELSLFGRYYGPGYERGDWTFLRSLAEWLERQIEGCEVWYGGDSSGILHEHLDAEKREEITNHFWDNGHRPYVGGWPALATDGSLECPFCNEPMDNCGGGRDFDFYSCSGCGKKGSKHRKGKVAWAKRHAENFPWFDEHGDVIPEKTA